MLTPTRPGVDEPVLQAGIVDGLHRRGDAAADAVRDEQRPAAPRAPKCMPDEDHGRRVMNAPRTTLGRLDVEVASAVSQVVARRPGHLEVVAGGVPVRGADEPLERAGSVAAGARGLVPRARWRRARSHTRRGCAGLGARFAGAIRYQRSPVASAAALSGALRDLPASAPAATRRSRAARGVAHPARRPRVRRPGPRHGSRSRAPAGAGSVVPGPVAAGLHRGGPRLEVARLVRGRAATSA